MLTCSNRSAVPSMQVSSFVGSNATNATAFYTAPSRFVAPSTIAPLAEHCRQLFIRHVPGYKQTMALGVEPHDALEDVKEKVRRRINLPSAQFQLKFSGRILRSGLSNLAEDNIPHNSTLTCVSFRPDEALPGPWFTSLAVVFKTLTDKFYTVHGVTDHRFCDVVKALSELSDIPIKHMRVIHCGRQYRTDSTERFTDLIPDRQPILYLVPSFCTKAEDDYQVEDHDQAKDPDLGLRCVCDRCMQAMVNSLQLPSIPKLPASKNPARKRNLVLRFRLK